MTDLPLYETKQGEQLDRLRAIIQENDNNLIKIHKENQQLKARVHELEELCLLAYMPFNFTEEQQVSFKERLNRTPPQSLAELKAGVLEDFANEIGSYHMPSGSYSNSVKWALAQARERANQLREESK